MNATRLVFKQDKLGCTLLTPVCDMKLICYTFLIVLLTTEKETHQHEKH